MPDEMLAEIDQWAAVAISDDPEEDEANDPKTQMVFRSLGDGGELRFYAHGEEEGWSFALYHAKEGTQLLIRAWRKRHDDQSAEHEWEVFQSTDTPDLLLTCDFCQVEMHDLL